MSNSTLVRKKKRRACVGDMRDRINLQIRSLTPPENGSVDFTEVFNPKTAIWSTINTVRGRSVFDGTETEVDVTHEVLLRHVEGLTMEDWVLKEDSERLRILTVENLDERDDWQLLQCTNRGTNANKANEL